MNEIAVRRLRTQRLAGEPFATVEEVVGWLGAVQSQDYAGAKWALGMRARGVGDADLDRLFDAGAILRTHVMRPTWHFVLPEDVRWLLELTAPRVKALLAHSDPRLEIDAALLRRSYAVVETALRDGTCLTRAELAAELERAGIGAVGQRLAHLVMHAELDGVVVSGPRRGRQHTYALLAERAPHARRLAREEALAELTLRYFTGHGPAQPRDFAWWSGLTVGDAKRGLDLVGPALTREVLGGKPHWSSPSPAANPPVAAAGGPAVHLLPNYDELLVAYRDRSAALPPSGTFDVAPFPYGSILAHVVVVDGRVWGGWKWRPQRKGVVVELGRLEVLDAPASAGLERAAADLARFLDTTVNIVRPAA
ncbi:MAG TPA: winged helix DNA-binding domain-containing protein [Candidatus Dormibacteraeota bacterium]|nr:winged helix DNA-binding domain-containing protein [Candidatus Dormibacteraeota bacterium]